MPHAIELSSVSKSFGNIHAVLSLSLTVKKGEVHALVGPDGAGKTTLIRMLCGILCPDSGSATVLGFDTVREANALKTRIGYLSQRFSLYHDLSVDENIAFFAHIHNVKAFEARRESLLEFTRLEPFRDRLAGALSGGMKQKLALACTLIHTPELIFLDEPTTGVDPVTRRDFWSLLSSLQKDGVTIFLSTPYLDEAERCQTVSLMNEGRLIAGGSLRDLQERYGETTLELLTESPRADERVIRALPRLVPLLSDSVLFGEKLNLMFHSLSPSEAEAVVKEELNRAGIPIRSLRIRKSSLEHIYIRLVREYSAQQHQSLIQ